jgi:C4-dicarboxylate-binding protein DctP
MKKASDYEKTLSEELNNKSLEIMKKSGKVEIYTLTPAERQEFIKALAPLYKTYEGKIGKANLDYAKSLK